MHVQAEIHQYEEVGGSEQLIGSVKNGVVFHGLNQTKARVDDDGRIYLGDDWIAQIDLKTGHVVRGMANDLFSVGNTDPDGTVYDESAIKLGRVELIGAESLSDDEHQQLLFLVGGATRMTLLNYEYHLNTATW